MKEVVAEVTAPSLDEEGCQIYHWSEGANDPTLFLLYMEWRDKACFEAHIATPHVKHAEDCLKREKMRIEPAKEWHFYRLGGEYSFDARIELSRTLKKPATKWNEM